MIASAGHHFCRCPCEMFPHCLSRCGDIKIPGHVGIGPHDFDVRALVLFLPCLIEVAQPKLNIANDVDSFAMRDEPLRRWLHAHSLDTGVALKRIGAAAYLLTYCVLEQPMDQDHIASSMLFAPAHLLLHHFAVMNDELKIKIAHRNASFALAGRRLLDVAQPAPEFEISRLDSVLAASVRNRRPVRTGAQRAPRRPQSVRVSAHPNSPYAAWKRSRLLLIDMLARR
jgi:hypothetical protein